jgi:hypothetical protein
VTKEEKAVGIRRVLDRKNPRVAFAPEGLLPVELEEMRVPDWEEARGGSLRSLSIDALTSAACFSRRRLVRLMSGNARIGGLAEGAADRQRKSL